MKIDITKTVNELHDEAQGIGDKVADNVASLVGSWRFVLSMTTFLALWVVVNIVGIFGLRFDPMPFILLNLCLSFLAGYTGPFIMMSQNRQASKDRIAAEHDYATNEAAKVEIEGLVKDVAELVRLVLAQNEHLDEQDKLILEAISKKPRSKA